jgi:cytochrome c553
VNAIAVYLESLPPVRERNSTPWKYNDGTVALLRSPFTLPGAATYYQYCASCHAPNGKGYRPHPPLAGNPAVLDPDPVSLINLTLNGSLRVIANGRHAHYSMPYMRLLLSDSEIADVLSFVRVGWGNHAGTITASQVSAVRKATDPVTADMVILKMK